LFDSLPEGASPIVASKPDDPQEGGWRPLAAARVEGVCLADRNNYFNCASFYPSEDGTLFARKGSVAAYHCAVLDDVGTKIPRVRLGDIEPTWMLETSPGNYQVGFRLAVPLTDPASVERLQERIKAAGLTDTGSLGMVRWVRLPNAINGKPKYFVDGKPFACRLHQWNPSVSYAAEELRPARSRLGGWLPAAPGNARVSSASNGNGVYFARNPENPVVAAFVQRGLYKRELSPGKHDVRCPWVEQHTDSLDDGAAYFEPSEDYPLGGFRCHHSHGDKYTIREVLEEFSLTEQQARNRTRIWVVAGEMRRVASAAEKVLALRGGFKWRACRAIKSPHAGQRPQCGDDPAPEQQRRPREHRDASPHRQLRLGHVAFLLDFAVKDLGHDLRHLTPLVTLKPLLPFALGWRSA
jgi:hypothetical protein